MIKLLEGHEGLVKGLAWDPIGKYLASFGDDKRLIIWNTSNWEIHTEIKEPFEKKVDAIFFRLSWTPEGGCLICPGSLNGKTFVASLISRKDFKVLVEFKGHKGAFVVAKVNPKMFKKDGSQIAYIALGDQAGNVFIYSTDSDKEKLYLKNIFKESVTEITWSTDGLKLFISSLGGIILEFSFHKDFFGEPISQSEIQSQLNEKYGEVGNNFQLIEDVSFVNKQPSPLSVRFEQPQQTAPKLTEIVVPQSTVKRTEPIKQIESTKNGKKRITPMLIQKPSPQQTISNVEPIDIDAPVLETRTIQAPVMIEKSINETNQNFEKVTLKRKKKNENESVYKKVKGNNLILKLSKDSEVRCTKEGNIELFENSQSKWKRSFYQTIQTASCNSKYIVIASTNTVFVLNYSGIFKISPFALEVAYLALNDSNHLAILTKDLTYYQWDLEKEESIVQTSIQPLLLKNEDLEVDDLGLNKNNMAIITLSNGESYSYHPKMKVWICIADSQFIMSTLLGKSLNDSDEYSLPKLKEKAYEKLTELKISTPTQNSRDTFGDLEKAIHASEELGNFNDFLTFAKQYSQLISKTSDSIRLMSLCENLIEERKIGNGSSRTILKDCLEMISNSKLQRIVIAYKTMLKDLQ